MNGIAVNLSNDFFHAVVEDIDTKIQMGALDDQITLPFFSRLDKKLNDTIRISTNQNTSPRRNYSYLHFNDDDVSCGEYRLLESDSANNWVVFTEQKKNWRCIKGYFSGTYVLYKNNCWSPNPFPADTVRFRNGYFESED
jgi:hypothetical protein